MWLGLLKKFSSICKVCGATWTETSDEKRRAVGLLPVSLMFFIEISVDTFIDKF